LEKTIIIGKTTSHVTENNMVRIVILKISR